MNETNPVALLSLGQIPGQPGLGSQLADLRGLILEMTDLLIYQLEQSLHALNFCDGELALKVIARDRKIDALQNRLDHQATALISQMVTNEMDLRAIVTLIKIAIALEKIGNELTESARLVLSIHKTRPATPPQDLLNHVNTVGNSLKVMLDKLVIALENQDSRQAHNLIRQYAEAEHDVQAGLEQHVSWASRHYGVISQTLLMSDLMKTLSSCRNHARAVAARLILMFDGIDIRSPMTGSH